MMSPILPPVTMNMAITSEYMVMIAWMTGTVVSKSSTSWLIETFMTAWSRTIRNWARPRTARGAHFFMDQTIGGEFGGPATKGAD